MNKILAYKVFSSSDEFVEWQRNYNKTVTSIVPFITDISTNSIQNNCTYSSAVGCFVTYIEE